MRSALPCLRPSRSGRPVTLKASTVEGSDKVAWDPEGLLPATSSGGHFARRDRQQQATSQAPAAPPQRPPPPGARIRPLAPAAAASGDGIPASDTASYDCKAFKRSLAQNFMRVDLAYPGLRILHLDPPVFVVDDFFSAQECSAMVEGAVATGRMAASKVGVGNLADAAQAALSSRRTSTSLLVDGWFPFHTSPCGSHTSSCEATCIVCRSVGEAMASYCSDYMLMPAVDYKAANVSCSYTFSRALSSLPGIRGEPDESSTHAQPCFLGDCIPSLLEGWVFFFAEGPG